MGKRRAKVRAGGILWGNRKNKDNHWGTPEFILERARIGYAGPIPFDPATTPENPTKALRFCAGVPGTLFAGAGPPCVECQGEGFVDDPAASPATALSPEDPPAVPCPACWWARRNGLEVPWDPVFWVNPPFEPEWIKKVGAEVRRGCSGFAVFPCNRYEEPYLQKVLSLASAVCHVDAEPFQHGFKLPHRVAFLSSKDGAPVMSNPYATQILNFNMPLRAFLTAFEPLGPCYEQRRISLRGVPPWNGALQMMDQTQRDLRRQLEECAARVGGGGAREVAHG